MGAVEHGEHAHRPGGLLGRYVTTGTGTRVCHAT
jgi:hypothetical protein